MQDRRATGDDAARSRVPEAPRQPRSCVLDDLASQCCLVTDVVLQMTHDNFRLLRQTDSWCKELLLLVSAGERWCQLQLDKQPM